MRLSLWLLLLIFSAAQVDAGTITRPTKTFSGTSFVDGVIPQASDFNGDIDTVYGEFNGNIENINIRSNANIAASKINPDGFTVNVRTVNNAPCKVLDESDQTADSRRWAVCSNGGVFQLGTYSDTGVLQNNWLTIARANGGFTIGGTSGTNVINGATTFNQTVTFGSGTTLLPTGTVMQYMGLTSPSGWLLLDGSSNSCTGASSVNANLCAQLVSLYATVNYKGAALGTFTVDTASNEIIHTAHGKAAGDRVHFTSTATLPIPLSATVVYCIISTTTDRYKISGTCGGAETDITSTGSGTHSDYFNFKLPDARGRVAVGAGTATYSDSGGDAEVNLTNETFTVPSNDAKWITGTQVTLNISSGSITCSTSCTDGSTWYIIRHSATTVQLATTLANAQNGTNMTMSAKSSPVWSLTHTDTARTLGEIGGEQTHAMTSTELLAHTHGSNLWRNSGGSSNPSGVGTSSTANSGSTGGNAAMNVLDPFLVMSFIIKL